MAEPEHGRCFAGVDQFVGVYRVSHTQILVGVGTRLVVAVYVRKYLSTGGTHDHHRTEAVVRAWNESEDEHDGGFYVRAGGDIVAMLQGQVERGPLGTLRTAGSLCIDSQGCFVVYSMPNTMTWG